MLFKLFLDKWDGQTEVVPALPGTSGSTPCHRRAPELIPRHRDRNAEGLAGERSSRRRIARELRQGFSTERTLHRSDHRLQRHRHGFDRR